MRELGETSEALHAGLAPDLLAAKPDLVFCCGPHMAALWRGLENRIKGAHAEVSMGLIAKVVDEVGDGDIVTIKGSLGTNMAPVVKALLELNSEPPQSAATEG